MVALLTTEKAPIAVALDDGTGNKTELGLQFHFSISPAIAAIENQSGTLYVVALAAGDAVLHITTMDGTVATDVELTIADGPPPPPPPPAPQPFLVVTIGTPVAK